MNILNPLTAKASAPVRLILSENAFVDWILSAKPGDAIVYHRGLLVYDRHSSKRMTRPERLELNRIANRAMEACEAGFVFLQQRKHGYEDYSYLAVARSLSSVGQNLSREVSHERF